MKDNTNEQQVQPSQGKQKDTKKWVTWLLAALALLFLVMAGYLWWQLRASQEDKEALEKNKRQLQAQVDKLKSQAGQQAPSEDEDVACNDTPSDAMKENIKAALDSKNTAAFATYTSNPVRFVLAASEKGGNETPDEAAVSLEYTHSATGPWDFTLPAATIDGYDAGFYTDYFDANTYVGKAASGMVVAFDFDCDGKISQIFVAADEDLL